MSDRKTAILVDGGFFLKRFPWVFPKKDANDPAIVAKQLHDMAVSHLKQGKGKNVFWSELYRIFVYDCPPLHKKAHNPVSGKSVDFSKSDSTKFRDQFHENIRNFRKTALRLGHLAEESAQWQIKENSLKALFNKEIQFADLKESDVIYHARQKVVDMKIGLDIAAIAFKKQVNQIVLVSGDSDFVPAAKLARREGIDFILDPMWHYIRPDLVEHIDGLRSVCPKPSKKAMDKHGQLEQTGDAL